MKRRGDLLCGDAGGEKQAGEGVGRFDGLLASCVGMQLEEDLAVREAGCQGMSRVDRERALADSGHSVDRVDAHHAARALCSRHQLRQISFPVGEVPDVMRQHGCGGGHRPRAHTTLRGQSSPSLPEAARRCLERHPGRPGQTKRVGQ